MKISTLASKIKATGAEHINLIDFENVNTISVLQQYLNNENVVNIFFYNATRYSNRYYSITKDSGSHNIQFTVDSVSNQLIDKLIFTYLGGLLAMLPKKEYSIISKDHGYTDVVEYLDQDYDILTYYTTDYETEDEKIGRYKFALARYIDNTYNITESKMFTRSDIKYYFYRFYSNAGKILTEKNLDNLIETMTEFGFIKKIDSSKVDFWMFNLKKVNMVLEREDRA